MNQVDNDAEQDSDSKNSTWVQQTTACLRFQIIQVS